MGFVLLVSRAIFKGYIPYLEWIAPGTTHPVDVAVKIDGLWVVYEVCVSTMNLSSHIEACFEKSPVVNKLIIVVATKTKLKELKKLIKSDLMMARYKGRIELNVIENYMERFKK